MRITARFDLSGQAPPPEPPPRGKRSRLRRFFLRHLPLSVAAAALLLVHLGGRRLFRRQLRSV